jgi:DNA replication and repair protein RecF
MSYTSISQLKLTNFRNYLSQNFNFTHKVIAIYGNNGVGKTNILEAISLLTKGNGIKNAEFDEMICRQNHLNNFTIYSNLEHHPDIENIGTSYSRIDNKKIFQINNKILTSHSRNKTSPAIIWLTPQMDNLFCSSKTLRRKFLDKIVADIDTHHNSRLNLYNHSLRERINLLNNFANKQENWLDIIERKIAELGTAIATARNEAIYYLNQAILQNNHHFTKTNVKMIGELEDWAQSHKAIEVEEKFIEKLKANRPIDKKSGRTNFGVHRSDLTAILLDKKIEAKFCSTGEQKSILIAITFARVKIFSLLNLPSAILLLDEIVSHLDNQKRANLLEEISQLNCQSFLTATNKDFFSSLSHFEPKITQFLEID